MSLRPEAARSGRSRSRSRSRSRNRESESKRSSRYDVSIVSPDPRSSLGGLPYPSPPDAGSASIYINPPESGYYRTHASYSDVPYAMSGGNGLGLTPESDRSHSLTDSFAQFLPTKYSNQLLGSDEDRERRKQEKEKKKQEKKEKLDDDLAYGTFSPTGQEVPQNVDLDSDFSNTPSGHGHHNSYPYPVSPEHMHTKDDKGPPIPIRYNDYLSPNNKHDEGKRHRRWHSNSSVDDTRQSRSSNITTGTSVGGRREQSRERRSPIRPRLDTSAHHRHQTSNSQPFLSVDTPQIGSMSLSSAPPSPLLEAYHGTYQMMSPVPSPILGPQSGFTDIPPLSSEYRSSSDSSEDESDTRSPSSPKRSRRARFHDPGDDALRIAKALTGGSELDVEPLLEILPGMTHSQVMELRVEYKRIVKTGAEKKGVNVAKHIRSRLKDCDRHLMKACYATALGRWESEAHWANFWYQGDKNRRELLIEALFGRSNDEIRSIKEGFYDKKYSNSLTQCMETELKEDKFKKCVMMVLKEERENSWDRYGRPIEINREKVSEDVEDLHKALRKKSESGIFKIVLVRSDAHLKEVMRTYGRVYKSSLARDIIKMSGNLVVSTKFPCYMYQGIY